MAKRPNQTVVSKKEIGDRIRILRQEQGLTQIQLSEILDMTQSNLSAIERGVRGVTVHQVVRIAKAMRASTDQILLAQKAPESGARPKKRLMRRLLRIQELKDKDQKILLDLLDSFVLAAQKRRLEQAGKDSRVA